MIPLVEDMHVRMVSLRQKAAIGLAWRGKVAMPSPNF